MAPFTSYEQLIGFISFNDAAERCFDRPYVVPNGDLRYLDFDVDFFVLLKPFEELR